MSSLHSCRLFAVAIFLCLASTLASAYTHNVGAQALMSPGPGARVPVNLNTPISIRFSNTGTSDETSVMTYVRIVHNGATLYLDSVRIDSWASAEVQDITFKDFIPQDNGPFDIIAYCYLAPDENRTDDTLLTRFNVRYESDAAAIEVTHPTLDEVKLQKVSFAISGTFNSLGNSYLNDVAARVQIRRCVDNQLVFQSDSLIPDLFPDSTPMRFTFPSHQGPYDVRKLLPGCYKIAIIARYPTDGDRTNDTSYSSFSIAAHSLSDDIRVDSILQPQSTFIVSPGSPFNIAARFRNTGSATESNIPVTAVIKDLSGAIVYSNSSTIVGNLAPGTTRDVAFNAFTPSAFGVYTLSIISQLTADQYNYDDTLRKELDVGRRRDVEVVGITSPKSDTSIQSFTPFTPKAQFRWLGSDSATYGVRIGEVIRFCDGSGPVFSYDTSVAPIKFGEIRNATFPTMSLDAGCYTLSFTVRYPDDLNFANDTLSVSFNVRPPHDLRVDSIVTPRDSSNQTSGPVPIVVAFTNIGGSLEQGAVASVVVKDQEGNEVHSSSQTIHNWQVGQQLLLNFTPFNGPTRALYTIAATVSHPDDHAPDNNAITSAFWLGAPVIDVQMVSATVPSNGQVMPSGSAFSPTGKARWAGGFADLSNVMFEARIEDCTTHAFVYGANVVGNVEVFGGETRIVFPYSQGPYNTEDLPDGCYRMALIALLPEDGDRSNDTVYSTFSIGEAAVVSDNLSSGFRLAQNTPNPATDATTISYHLPTRCYARLSVADIDGRQISVPVNAWMEAGHHSIPIDTHALTPGTYVVRLEASNPNGEPVSLIRRMVILPK